jgi:hypothetical protein
LSNIFALPAIGRSQGAPVVHKGLVEDQQKLNKKPVEVPFIEKEQPTNVFEQGQKAKSTPIMREEQPTNAFWLYFRH